jgi:mRNA interferase MazF
VKRPGQVALMRFPQVDLAPGKPRPVLLVARVPGPYDDWPVCMFSTKLHQALPDFDEILDRDAGDFDSAGLAAPSVVRVARLAVVSADLLIGTLGEISQERLGRVRTTLAGWIRGRA